jgi:hypothetical protein
METGTLGSVRYVAVDPHSAECGRRRTCGSKLRGTSKRVRESANVIRAHVQARGVPKVCAVMPYLMRASSMDVCRTAGEVGVAERRSLAWNSTTKTDRCCDAGSGYLSAESTHGSPGGIARFLVMLWGQ